MRLTIPERLLLLNALPKEGDITRIRIIRELREALSFTEEEHVQFGIVQEGDRIGWDSPDGGARDVDIGETALGIARETMQKMNEEKALTERHISLFEKICERADVPEP